MNWYDKLPSNFWYTAAIHKEHIEENITCPMCTKVSKYTSINMDLRLTTRQLNEMNK